ncbi:MAG TPA: ShlB/FhaC/HecB family hemolysin secretion/activation protein [Arsenophonus sp.]
MLALDNPTSLSDLFYITAIRDDIFSDNQHPINYSIHYSLPLGY